MKKVIISWVLFSLIATGVSAQRFQDLLTISNTQPLGTARYMGMSGAFSALGGDMSAMIQNPAGLGIYRSSDVSITPFLQINQSSAATREGVYAQGSGTGSVVPFNLSNAGIALAFTPKNGGWLENVNLGVSYNKMADFNRDSYLGGSSLQNRSLADYFVHSTNGIVAKDLYAKNGAYNNQSIPWGSTLAFESYLINPINNKDTDVEYNNELRTNEPVTASNLYQERGWINEFDIALGFNFNHKIYAGLSLGIQDVYYSATSVYSEHLPQEKGRNYFDLINYHQTRGTGVNIKVGIIARPWEWLRIAAAYHSPMFYSLEEVTDAKLKNYLKDGTAQPNSGDYFRYAYHSPMKVVLGAAAIIGGRAVVSFDYEWAGFKGAAAYVNSQPQKETNDLFGSLPSDQHSFRLGGEYRVMNGFSVRAGGSYILSAAQNFDLSYTSVDVGFNRFTYVVDQNAWNVSAGFGYQFKNFYIDFAYIYKNQGGKLYHMLGIPQTERYYGIADSELTNDYGRVNFDYHQLFLTFGAKF